MNDTSEDDLHHDDQARLGQARRIQLSPEPAQARRQLEDDLGHRWRGEVTDVLLAVSEALVNASRHAGGTRRAEALVDDTSLVIQVWDRGQGFDPTPYVDHPPDVMAERGRGLWLISRLADTCEVRNDEDGSLLVLRFEARQEGHPGRETVGCHPA